MKRRKEGIIELVWQPSSLHLLPTLLLLCTDDYGSREGEFIIWIELLFYGVRRAKKYDNLNLFAQFEVAQWDSLLYKNFQKERVPTR